MLNGIKQIKRDFSKWSLFSIIISLLIAIPVFSILVYLFDGVGEMWRHIVSYFLIDYVKNSLILILGTGTLSFIFGTSCAWIVSQYQFKFRAWSDRLLFLPLAIPTYIVAYSYVGIFGNGGTIINLFQSIGFKAQKIDMMNIYGLIWILSCSLFPYVYVSARAMFITLPKNIKESATLLGASNRKYFYTIALPLASPAIIGGLLLVFMEVLNDFGAAKYYGVNTFTTGIFKSWTMLEDLQSSIYLSALLVLLVFLINILIRWQRGRKSFEIKSSKTEHNLTDLRELKGSKKYIYISILMIPILFGFLLPISQLIKWAILNISNGVDIDLLWTTMQSISVSLVATLFIVITAIVLIYFARWNKINSINKLKKIATIGYVIPGAIIGIGIIRSSQSIIDFFTNNFNTNISYLFYGSSIVLIYAYTFRFLAVAYNPIEANSLKLSKNLSEASNLLGVSKMRTFFKIELPLLKNVILSALILVFIDVSKELPLTLILKPYKLQTLATAAYTYAEDERVSEAALPALLLITVITIAMFTVKFKDGKK